MGAITPTRIATATAVALTRISAMMITVEIILLNSYQLGIIILGNDALFSKCIITRAEHAKCFMYM